jgi:beta-lactamase regulating signal transducer with metallopeptidase domain
MNMIIEHINLAGAKFVDFTLPMLIQSVVLILILLLVDLALRRKLRAVFRYWIWMLVLVKLVLPTSLTSPLSMGYLIGDRLEYMDSAEITSRPQAELVETRTANIPPYIDLSNIRPARFTPSSNPIKPNTELIPGTVITKVEPEYIKPAKALIPVTPLSWQGVVFLLWLAAVIVMSLLILQRVLFIMGLLRQARPANNLMTDALEYCQERMKVRRNVRLKVSFNATSPAVCGLFRPVILLPQDLGPTLGSSHLRTVIMHELAHIKRGDLWVNTIQVVLQIFYLYNPLLWLANSMIRRVREQAVDETVLVAMGPKAQQYPETLLNVARLAWQRPALSLRLIGVIESKSQLKERIRKMLERPAPKSAKLGIAGILIIIALGAFLLPMANAKNSEDETSKVTKELKAEKEAEVKMLQDKITQLEKHLKNLQKQVQQRKSQIAVAETKAKEQSDLSKKEKQKAEKDKQKAAKEKVLVKEKLKQLEQLKQLEPLLQKLKEEKLQKYQTKETVKERIKSKIEELLKALEDIEKDEVDVDNVDVVVAPKPMPKPMPKPHPVHKVISVAPVAPVAPVASVAPATQVAPVPPALPKLPKLPKIVSPPIPEIPVDGKSIKVIVPKIEPPKEIIQQISRVHTERAALERKMHELHKELDKRKEHDNISDDEVEKFEQEIEELENKQEMLEESAEALEDRLEAWSEQVREQVADRYEKIRDQVRVKVEGKHEEQRKQYEKQRQQFERQHEMEFEGQMRQFEHQMQQLERQMEQLERQKEQLEHQKEQLDNQKEHVHEKELEQLDKQIEQSEQQFEHEHEKDLEQLERQMEQFERQMEQWNKQHQHQMEQFSQKFDKDFDVSIQGLENELEKIDVKVDVKVDAKADADADVVVDGSKDGEEKATFTKGPNIITAPLEPGRKILVKNRIGSINVSSGKAGQCTCSITVKATAETIEQASQKAKPVKLEVDDDNEVLNLVVIKTDNDEWEDINVDLNIQVPPGSGIVVNNDIGNLRMVNLEGEIKGQTNVGNILASNVQGNIKLLTNVGQVIYEVPEKISAEVRGSTDVGKIKTELPLDVIKNFQKSQISGVLGEGKNKVDLKTKVGNITIRKAKPPVPEDKPM